MSRYNHRIHILIVMTLVIMSIVGLTFIAGQAMAEPTVPEVPHGSEWVVQDTSFFGDEIEMVSAVDGWVLRPKRGGDGPSGGYLYRWNGSQWATAGILPHSQEGWLIGDIAMTSATDGWLALGPFPSEETSESTIFHWDGNEWANYEIVTASDGVSLASIDMLSPFEGWMVGDWKYGTRFYHWDSISWQHDSRLIGVYAASDIEMVATDYGWAVGGDITHWNGNEWIPIQAPAFGWLYDVVALSQNDAWAVGSNSSYNGGIMLHWDGNDWTEVSNPAEDLIRAIDMISTTEGWAVGEEKGVAYHWNGVQWTKVSLPTAVNEYVGFAVDMLSESIGWIVGYKSVGNGVVLSYAVIPPELLINAIDGAPGSFFTIAGSEYPANEEAAVTVNGHDVGTVTTDENGAFTLILSTAEAGEGIYIVTVSINPSATTQFVLDSEAPFRPQQGEGIEIAVPAGIAMTDQQFLPVLSR